MTKLHKEIDYFIPNYKSTHSQKKQLIVQLLRMVSKCGRRYNIVIGPIGLGTNFVNDGHIQRIRNDNRTSSVNKGPSFHHINTVYTVQQKQQSVTEEMSA